MARGSLVQGITLAVVCVIVNSHGTSCRAQSAALYPKFDPATPLTGTTVSFDCVESPSASGQIVDGLEVPTIRTQEGANYVLKIDTENYRRDKYHRFSFDLYIRPGASPPGSAFHHFVVWEEPTGTFPDTVGPVNVHVLGPGGEGIATLQLPLHSDSSPNLNVAIPPDPYPIPMGSSSRMTLGFSNNLSKVPVTVDPSSITVVPTVCPSCWGNFSAKLIRNQLSGGQGTSLLVDIQPNTFEAFKRNLFVFDSKTAQENLVITVVSASAQVGADEPQDFHIPVRFTPPGGFILVSFLCGLLIGCVIRYLISLLTKKQSFLEISLAAITAGVAWLVVLGLYTTKTKVTVFGFDFDPTQVIPAGLITLFAAAGAPFARRVAEIIRGGKP